MTKAAQPRDELLLHQELFNAIPLIGGKLRGYLIKRIKEIESYPEPLKEPSISVLIRTKNDIAYIKGLFNDIKAQKFDGPVEIILVDTESNDGTVEFAKANGAKVLNIKQSEFNYPKALNIGFAQAKNDIVVTLVGHSGLCSRLMFRMISYWAQYENFAGVFCIPLPNWNATYTERLVWLDPRLVRYIRSCRVIKSGTGGLGGVLGANCSAIKRKVWESMGGYDEMYGAGGEELTLAKRILDSNLMIINDPLCSVFHSHGIGPINGLKQTFHWLQVTKKPRPFNQSEVEKRRPDMREKIRGIKTKEPEKFS